MNEQSYQFNLMELFKHNLPLILLTICLDKTPGYIVGVHKNAFVN